MTTSFCIEMDSSKASNERVQAFMRKYGATVVPVPVLIQMQQNAALPWTPTKVVGAVSVFLNRLSSMEAHLSSGLPYWGSGTRINFDTSTLFEDHDGRPYPYLTHHFVRHLYAGANASVRTMVLTMMYLKTIANIYGSPECTSFKVRDVFASAFFISLKQNN